MQNEAIIRSWFEEVWNQKNEQAIDKFISGKPHNELEAVGADEFKQFFRKTIASYPNIHFSVDDVVANENKVAARISVRLKYPDKPADLEGGVFCTLEDGKIRDAWNWNIFDFHKVRK